MSFVAGVKMKALNVHETKTKLSSILAQVEMQGEKFTICRNGKPIADLVPHQKKNRLEPHPLLSQVKVKCDLTAPLTQESWDLD
jgi:antitoxin (DNA-binding transcriptional repressor) of toxin-antitoxin stability system